MKQQEEQTNLYKPGKDADGAEPAATKSAKPTPAAAGISWTASEYVEHQRGAFWYAMLAVATVLITVAVYFATKDYFATGTVILVGVLVSATIGRKPSQMNFELSQSGLQAGAKTYSYNLFKSFSVIREGTLTSISLMPVKRFMPPVSAYFDPKDEQKIVNAIGEHLPYEERNPSAVDRLSFRLRI